MASALRRIVYSIAIIFASTVGVSAANEGLLVAVQNALKQLDSKSLTYHYNIRLVDGKTRTQLDDVSGRLWKYGISYLDSNKFMINVRDDRYTVQVNHPKKAVYVKSISNLAERSNGRSSVSTGAILDLSKVLAKNVVSTTVATVRGKRTLVIALKQSILSRLELTLRESGELESIVMASSSTDELGQETERVIKITEISLMVDRKIIDSQRFIKERRKAFESRVPYTGYKTIQLV